MDTSFRPVIAVVTPTLIALASLLDHQEKAPGVMAWGFLLGELSFTDAMRLGSGVTGASREPSEACTRDYFNNILEVSNTD